MSTNNWNEVQKILSRVMLDHVRPFSTPLGTSTQTNVRSVGTGSYIERNGQKLLLTCEHVAKHRPMHYRFHGSEDVYEHQGRWTMDAPPIDAAATPINQQAWAACAHTAAAIPEDRFATQHAPINDTEFFFFCAFSGENGFYGFGVHQTNGSGYLTQQKAEDSKFFELPWEPSLINLVTTTPAYRDVQWNDARGFSGGLVWNTRFLESLDQGWSWTPEAAQVTGMLQRWDNQDNDTLLVWRVEHLLGWLSGKGF